MRSKDGTHVCQNASAISYQPRCPFGAIFMRSHGRNIGCCTGNSGNSLSISGPCRHLGIVKFLPRILQQYIKSSRRYLDVKVGPRAIVRTYTQYITMPAIQHHHQRRSQPDGDIGHLAIIFGCIGLIFILACLLAIFVLRIKRHKTPSTEHGETECRSTDGLSQGNNHTEEANIGGEAQGSDEPPKYQAAEPAARQNDLPPAYESMEVWPGRSSRSSRPIQNWTSVWPLRSTQFG